MKWFFVVLTLFLAAAPLQAEGPDDQYVAVYNLIQEGDLLSNNGHPQQALAKYSQAQTALERFRKGYPEWNPKVVNFRLTYIAAKIATLQAAIPAPAVDTNQVTQMSAAATLSSRPRPSSPPDWQDQMSNLNTQVRQLQNDKTSLESKLKEALSYRPPPVDTNELARVQEQIRLLAKENDLLKLTLEQQKSAPVAAAPANAAELEQTRKALEQTRLELAEQTKKAKDLEEQKKYFQDKLNNLPPTTYNSNAIDATRKTVDAVDRKLEEQIKANAKLAGENNALQARLKTLTADAEAAAGLRSENQLLKKQLADLKALPPANAKTEDIRRQLALARTQIATLESDREVLRLEKTALEQRVKQATVATNKSKEAAQLRKLQQERDNLAKQLDATKFELNGRKGEVAMAKSLAADAQAARSKDADAIAKLQKERDSLRKELEDANRALAKKGKSVTPVPVATAAAPNGASRPEDIGRINKLQQERDDLRKQLDAANKDLAASRKGKASNAKLVEMENQVAGLRAQIEVFESRKVPYTPEELALFRKPDARLAAVPKTTESQPKEMSQASVALVADAQRYFAAKQYDKAEERYQEVVKQNEANGPTLANLAAVELELNNLDKAEANIKKSLQLSPNDAYGLCVLGRLKYRQGKYDDALDALGRAVVADPQNAEIENYLGLTLSQKGMRGPAEAALRKAIQIEPSYAEAHNNLAVIYVTQQPPLVELARWHYQKALDAGGAHNANLEKMLEAKKSAETTP